MRHEKFLRSHHITPNIYPKLPLSKIFKHFEILHLVDPLKPFDDYPANDFYSYLFRFDPQFNCSYFLFSVIFQVYRSDHTYSKFRCRRDATVRHIIKLCCEKWKIDDECALCELKSNGGGHFHARCFSLVYRPGGGRSGDGLQHPPRYV